MLPAKFVDHSHADAVVALADQDLETSKALFQQAWGDHPVLKDFAVVPYCMPGFDLAGVSCILVVLYSRG